MAVATEQWKKQGTLPLPAQMLLMAGEDVEGQGTNLRIRLSSLWPINKANAPTDDFERIGLERVAKEPQKPYTGIVTQGERRIFKAIYADRAVTKSCVECHNGHVQCAGGSMDEPREWHYASLGYGPEDRISETVRETLDAIILEYATFVRKASAKD